MRRLSVDAALAALGAAALWPVWAWYAQRLIASPEERVGLAALGAAALLLFRAPLTPRPAGAFPLPRGLLRDGAIAPRPSYALAAVLFAAYAASFPLLPPLLRAFLGGSALVALCSRWRLGVAFHPGLAALWTLSLPVIPSLDFYAGYPLRAGVALAAGALLRLGGFAVTARGATLDWAGTLVAVDAPCSGVHMLWGAVFLSTLLFALETPTWRRLLAALGGAAILAVAANVLRASALFYVESGLFAAPAWAHEMIGLVAFALAAAALVAVHRGFHEWLVHSI